MEEAQTRPGCFCPSPGEEGGEGAQAGSPKPEWQPPPAEVRASLTLQHGIAPRGSPSWRGPGTAERCCGAGAGCLLPAVVAHTPARSPAPRGRRLSWGRGPGGYGLSGDTGRPPIPCWGAARLAEGSGGRGDSRQVAAPAAGPPCPGLGRAAGAGGQQGPLPGCPGGDAGAGDAGGAEVTPVPACGARRAPRSDRCWHQPVPPKTGWGAAHLSQPQVLWGGEGGQRAVPPTPRGCASASTTSTFSFPASQHWLNWSDGAAERRVASHGLCPHRPPRMRFLLAHSPLPAWGTPHPAATAG